ncbi:UNVERIFIED_CONTAM: Non-capsid protein NS-1 [Trichonephila clavipes]
MFHAFPTYNVTLWETLMDHLKSHWKVKPPVSSDSELFNLLMVESFKEKFYAILGEPLRSVLSKSFGHSRRYVSDVLIVGNSQECRELLEWIAGGGGHHPGRLYGWVFEKTHIHVIHDCPFSNGMCRCRWRNHHLVRKCVKKSLRRPRYIEQFDWIDWVYVFLYFFLSKRTCRQEIWVDRRVRRFQSGVEDLRWADLCQKSSEILDRKREGIGHNSESEGPLDEESQPAVSRSVRTVDQKRSRFEKVCQLTSVLLKKYLCIPVEDLKKIILPSNEDHNLFLHDPANYKHFVSACQLFKNTLNSYSLLDLKNLLDKTVPKRKSGPGKDAF